MNTQRMLILGAAFVAAIFAALLVRNLIGGGTQQVKAAPPPPKPVTSEVLVAASNLEAGAPLTADSVRWQQWPKSSVDSSFITHETSGEIESIVKGTVARAPIIAGEPLTTTKIVHADAAGFMAASVSPGMRAISIGISTESGAGGFILPNDRVDVMVTTQVSDSPRRFATTTLLRSVRVLAVDQTFREDKDQKVVLAKTATLELTPHQGETLEMAQATGTISLALRALGDTSTNQPSKADSEDTAPLAVTVIGYGMGRAVGAQGE